MHCIPKPSRLTFSKIYSYLAQEATTKAVAQINSESDKKSFKSHTEIQIKSTYEAKQETTMKTSSLTITPSQRPQGPERQRSKEYFPDIIPYEEIIDSCAIVPTFLELMPPETFVKQGADVSLFCVIKGIPAPCVIWLFNKLLVDESATCLLRNDGSLCSLKLLKVLPKQSGFYTCKIVNAAGQAECNTHLRVTGWHLHVPSKYEFLHIGVCNEQRFTKYI